MSKHTNEELDFIFIDGLDCKGRTVFWGKEKGVADEDESNDFHGTNVDRVVRSLHILSALNHQPITLKMNSVGGSLHDAFYLVDEILACPCQIIFVGGGEICSAATLIMAICDERYVHANADIMIHELTSGTSGKYSNMSVDIRLCKDVMENLAKIYSENSLMSKDFYTEMLGSGRDIFITAEECVTLGLADAIIEPLKRGNLRKKRSKHLSKIPNARKINQITQSICKRANIKQAIKEVTAQLPAAEQVDPNIIIEEVKPEVPNEPIL